MTNQTWIEMLPLWGVFFVSVGMVLLSMWIGTLLGQRRRRKPDHEEEGSLGTIISATLGLLAFMLAFTFGIASERFQVRRQLLLDEVQMINTTYLRAGLLLEPYRGHIQKLLSEYVDLRINLAKMNTKDLNKNIYDVIARSETLQDQMWSYAVEMAKIERSSEIDALFIDSLNELINAQTSRFTVFRYKIPPMIWYVLCFITVLAMATVGYQVGLSGKSVLKVAIVLALTFSSVVFLIADLDSGTEGYLQVNQRPMFELQKKIQMSVEQTNPTEESGIPLTSVLKEKSNEQK